MTEIVVLLHSYIFLIFIPDSSQLKSLEVDLDWLASRVESDIWLDLTWLKLAIKPTSSCLKSGVAATLPGVETQFLVMHPEILREWLMEGSQPVWQEGEVSWTGLIAKGIKNNVWKPHQQPLELIQGGDIWALTWWEEVSDELWPGSARSVAMCWVFWMPHQCAGYSQNCIAFLECVGYSQNCVAASDSFWHVSNLKDVLLCQLSYILIQKQSKISIQCYSMRVCSIEDSRFTPGHKLSTY